MELGDIINLLLVIGFAVIAPIIGAISKKSAKKNKATNPASTQLNEQKNQEGFDVMHEFLQNESKKSEKSNLQEEFQNISENSKSESNKSKEETEYKSAKQENNHIYNKTAKVPKPEKSSYMHKSKKSSNLNRKIVKDFDGKKAVIYSEILQKKYF